MPEVAYRSSHPDVLAHWEATGTPAQAAWRERVKATLAELGVPGRNFVLTDGWNGISVTGVEYADADPVPEGWRRDKRSSLPDTIVPAQRTKVGKGIAERLAGLNMPNPRLKLPGGMPSSAEAKGEVAFLRPRVERYGGAVFVGWSKEPADPDLAKVDSAVWERIKLSEYYAVLEAEEAKAS